MPLPAHPRCLTLDPWAEDRLVLRDLLATQGWLVAGEATRWSRARRLLLDVNYSLVFLSEKLSGGDAWSLLRYLRRGTRVVVTTRDPANPLRAFEVNALDYLLKPVTAVRLANTLRRMEPESPPSRPAFDPGESGGTEVARPLGSEEILRVRTGRAYRFAAVKQIVLVRAQDDYSEVRSISGPRTMIRRAM